MTGMYSAIDLSQVPVPNVVETIDYEAILTAMLADLQSRWPQFSALVESDPAYKILEVCAYREFILRARVNDAARAVLLATATGADLDNLAAFFGVERLLLDAGDPAALPPVPPTYEADADLRFRVQLALEGFSTAGPSGAYMFHARSASALVKDVGVTSPAPGEVRVTVLSTEGNGAPSAPVLAAVEAALNDDEVRPLCDLVVVQGATILAYAVTATLEFFDGPDAAVVLAAAEAAVQDYVASAHRIGRPIRRSALFAALHQPGVAQVTLTAPAADIVPTATEAAWCTAVTVTEAP